MAEGIGGRRGAYRVFEPEWEAGLAELAGHRRDSAHIDGEARRRDARSVHRRPLHELRRAVLPDRQKDLDRHRAACVDAIDLVAVLAVVGDFRKLQRGDPKPLRPRRGAFRIDSRNGKPRHRLRAAGFGDPEDSAELRARAGEFRAVERKRDSPRLAGRNRAREFARERRPVRHRVFGV